jgi:hypothetical protein
MEQRFEETREALHRVVEHVLAAARYADTGHIGLQVIDGGFSTGPFGSEPKALSIVGDRLVVRRGPEQRSARLTTLRAAANVAGVTASVPATVYRPATAADPDNVLAIDPDEAVRIEAWYREVSQALTAFARTIESGSPGAPAAARQTLWPEHFDVAIRADEINYGGLAGDETVAEPYVYVGPPAGISLAGAFWNQSFGAVRTWSEVPSAAEITRFFLEGHRRTRSTVRAIENV